MGVCLSLVSGKFALSSLGPRTLDNVKTFLLIELEDAFIVMLFHFEDSFLKLAKQVNYPSSSLFLYVKCKL